MTSTFSRRELLALGMAGAGAGAGALIGAASAEAAAVSDSQVLSEALEIELAAAFAYQHLLGAGVLAAATVAAAREILAQEQEHVRALAAALRAAGGSLPAAPATVKQADEQLAPRRPSGRIADVKTDKDALNLLYDIESISIGIYFEGLKALDDPALSRQAASIMAAEAQHAVVIAQLLHPGEIDKIVPIDWVEGKK
jgi:rubrerythrin